MTATEAAPAGFGDALAAFLEHLGGQQFAIGARELINAHGLLLTLAAAGRLPATNAERFALLRPLLCRTPDQQRRFPAVLQQWAARPAAGAGDDTGTTRGGHRGAALRARWRRVAVAIGAAVLLAAIAAGTWRWGLAPAGLAPPAAPASAAASAPTDTGAGADQRAQADADPPGDLPLDRSAAHAARSAAWMGWAGVAGALLLAAIAAAYALRRVALQRLDTSARLDQRTLFGERVNWLARPPPLLRLASRELRRAREIDRLDLDITRSIAATLRRGGAFSPEHRARRGTPEYLILVERLGLHDQLARAALELVAALDRQGVAVDVYSYGSDPSHCTRLRLARAGFEAVPGGQTGLAQLASRAAGQRLFVFGDAGAWMDPYAASWRPGVRNLAAFGAVALFTPLPVPSWGAVEQWLGTHGVLVLPLQLLALVSAADWLVSQRALLTLDPDWPATYPPRLRDSPGLWVGRQSKPPQAEIDGLLFELQLFLGPRRLQTLAALAVFPVPSWPVTLALSRLLQGGGIGGGNSSGSGSGSGNSSGSEKGSAQGTAGGDALGDVLALASLPWLREGSWPDWLRDALQARLAPEHRAAVSGELQRRLRAASLGQAPRDGEVLSEVAVEPGLRARLARAWQRFATERWLATRRDGMLRRDLLFLGFVQRGVLPRLMLAVPPRLRRLLFRQGLPLLGTRPWLQLTGVAVALAALTLQLPPAQVWVQARLGGAVLPGVPLVAELKTAAAGPVTALAFSADGEWIARSVAGSVHFWHRDGTDGGSWANSAAATRLSFGRNGWLLMVADGRLFMAYRTGDSEALEVPVSSDITDAVLVNGVLAGRKSTDLDALAPPDVLVAAGATLYLYDFLEPPRPIFSMTRQIVRIETVPDGSWYAVAAALGTRVVTRSTTYNVARPDADGVGFNPRDGLIASVGADRLMDVRRGDGSGNWGPAVKGQAATFQQSGSHLLAIANDRFVHFFDATGTPVAELPPHPAAITAIAFSPNGRQFATADAAGTVRLWGEKLAARESGTWHQAGGGADAGSASASASAAASASASTPASATWPTPLFLGRSTDELGPDIETWRKRGIAIVRRNESDPDHCQSTVISQAPKAGAPLAPGSAIELHAAVNTTAFYPLVCRGDAREFPSSASPRAGFQRFTTELIPGTGKAADGLRPGQCAWLDRAFRPGEPSRLRIDLTPAQVQTLRPLVKSADRYVRFMAVNAGSTFVAGCFAPVAPVGPVATGASTTATPPANPPYGTAASSAQQQQPPEPASQQQQQQRQPEPEPEPASQERQQQRQQQQQSQQQEADLPDATAYFGASRSRERMRSNTLGAMRLARRLHTQGVDDPRLLALGLATVKVEGGFLTAGAAAVGPSNSKAAPGADALDAQVANVVSRLMAARPSSDPVAVLHGSLDGKTGIDAFRLSVSEALPLAASLIAHVTADTPAAPKK